MLRIAFCIAIAQAVYECACAQSVVAVGPRFTREPPLPSPVLKLGRTATLICRAVGSPRIDIEWRLNGIPLVDTATKSKLKITNFKPSDAGVYQCRATNAAGTIASRKATVRYHDLPKGFIRNPVDAVHYAEQRTRKAGPGAAVLECELEALPFVVDPVIHWERKDGFRRRRVDSGRYFAHQIGLRSFLQIHFLENVDFRSEFFCVATSPHILGQTVQSGAARLNRTHDAAATHSSFSERPSSISVRDGESAVLACAFSGAVTDFAWRRRVGNANVLVASRTTDPSRRLREDLYNLYFRSASQNDAGTYFCSAKDVVTQKRLSASAVLTVVAEPLFAKSPSQAVTAITGMTVGLMCRARSPSATITWLKDGAPIALDGSRVRRTENGTLNLSPVGKYDGGMYQCYIENEFDEGNQSTSHLVVEYPAFVTVPSRLSMLVMEGNNVSLPCSADGNPSGSKITYQWKRGDEEVAASNLTGNLTIQGATLADSGEYTCVPFNRHGTESTAIVVLTVKPKEPLPPVVTVSSPVVIVNESDPITVSCAVEYYNQSVPVSWRATGNADGLGEGVTLSDDRRTLHVPAATRSHAGPYTCVVETYLGTAWAHVNVTVQYPPRNLPVPDDFRFFELGPGDEWPELRCPSEAVPPPAFTWEKDGGAPFAGLDVVVDDEQASVLQLKNVNGSVSGEYTCRAENPLGNSETTFVVTIAQTPSSKTESPGDRETFPTTFGDLIDDNVDLYIIIGSVVGGIVVASIFLVCIVLCCCRGSKSKKKTEEIPGVSDDPRMNEVVLRSGPVPLEETYRRTFIALDADDDAENPRKILPRTYSISSQTSGFLSQLNLEPQQQQQPVERRDEELATFKYDMTWPRRHSRMMRSQSQPIPSGSIDDLAAEMYEYNYT